VHLDRYDRPCGDPRRASCPSTVAVTSDAPDSYVITATSKSSNHFIITLGERLVDRRAHLRSAQQGRLPEQRSVVSAGIRTRR
jgi:hypothetical protein